MHYNVRKILGSTALALIIGICAAGSIHAQITPPPVQNNVNSGNAGADALNFDTNLPELVSQENGNADVVNAPIPPAADMHDVNQPIPLENNANNNPSMPVAINESGNIPNDMGNAPIFPMNDNDPVVFDDTSSIPVAPGNTAPQARVVHGPDNYAPIQAAADQSIPSSGNIPDLIPGDDGSDGLGDNILNKIDNNLFSKMSSIEKQSALLSLELRREKIRNEIAAIKAQRQKAQQEEQEAQEEKQRKRIEWENEQKKKMLVEQQKIKELENQRELLRQEKLVKVYKEKMLEEKQQWIKNNEAIYQALAEAENERDMLVNDFKMKLNNLKNLATKTYSDAENAKGRYDKAISALRTQISVLKARLEAELAEKLNKGNPFAELPVEKQVRLSDVYAIMEVVGKGENLAAKLINKNGDHFMVRRGTALQTGHVVDEITETYVRADLNGSKDYLYFAAGGILDSEPINNSVISGAKAAAQSAANAKKQTTNMVSTPGIPSLGDGMFVR